MMSIPLTIVSDDYPDFLCQAGTSYAIGAECLLAEEACIDMVPYLEEYASDLYALLQSGAIVESEFSLSFTAFSGSEGIEVFRYTLMFSDSTAQLVGFCCGVKPFFRSFMPLRGAIVE